MIHANKAIITCAVTGAVHLPCQSDYLPITPDQIVEESVAAAEAGAAIIHLHARDPHTGRPTTDPDVYGQFLPRIKQQTNAILNITTGQPGTFEERMLAPMRFAPELCSFNMGPMNAALFALLPKYEKRVKHAWEREFMAMTKSLNTVNTFENMEYIARELGEKRGVRFEFECFDIGHLHSLRFIADQGWIKPPFFIQSIYGFVGGLGAHPAHVLHMKQTADELFGDQYYWSNLAAGRNQMKFITLGAILGGNVRVGLEDSLWEARGIPARSNADQVRRIRRILEDLSIDIATPDEARAMLGTKGADKVDF
ncbi:3-keto-5-aminohexanoate cleavage protein [Sphingosinicella sp.]|uniref:3-keto-5-aminohexanoate cleavage protein n=1 Tax=Sphingosinicella sp. TaxID=1917971 RepID=UPI0035B32065